METRAFKIALIATGHEDEALELVQESMLQLVQKYADKPEPEWSPLFHRILQSKIRDWYRRQKIRNQWRVFFRNDEAENELMESTPAPHDKTGPDQLERQRAMEKLEQALHHLPLRQQQAFLLRAWEGFNVTETAQAMGCSEGSVKTHYSRAIHSLRELLEQFR